MKNNRKERLTKAISIYKKEITLIGLAIIILLFSIINLIVFSINKNYVPTIMYRTYTKTNGWSKWTKNGKNSGFKNQDITGIQVKLNSKYKGHVFYDVYYNGKWSDLNTHDGKTAGNKKSEISGIRVNLTDETFNRYSIYYTTHNKSDKWMLFNKDGYQSGNAKRKIDMIKILISKKDNSNYEKPIIGKTRYKNFD